MVTIGMSAFGVGRIAVRGAHQTVRGAEVSLVGLLRFEGDI
jgi:hypothetical protein